MRILIVPNDFPSAQRPQMGIFILRRAQAVAALGHEVAVLTHVPLAPPLGAKWSEYSAIPEFEVVEGIPVHTVRVPMLPRMLGAEYIPSLLLPVLEREIEHFQPDIVHASYVLPSGQLAVRQTRVPVIVTSHGIDAYDIPFRRRGLRKASAEAISKAARVTAVSGYIARCLQKIAFRHVDVIWNGADERFFYPRDREASRRALGLPADRTIAAYAGHVLRDKGLFELVQALEYVDSNVRPLLVVAGDGADRAALEREAAARRVETRFLGGVPHERVADVFGAADMTVLPSYYEGLPNVVCEAMLSERAVVATTVGGIPEIVQSGSSGILVPPQEVQPLADALKRMSVDGDFRTASAQRARAFAVENLTWRGSAKRYERLYEEVREERLLHARSLKT